MIDLNMLISFFGWCSIINMSVLLFSFICILFFREVTLNIHSKLTGVASTDLPTLYFQHIGTYKIITLIFNITPYIALKIISSS